IVAQADQIARQRQLGGVELGEARHAKEDVFHRQSQTDQLDTLGDDRAIVQRARAIVVAARQGQAQPAHAWPPSSIAAPAAPRCFARWIWRYTRARSSANRGDDQVASCSRSAPRSIATSPSTTVGDDDTITTRWPMY